MIGNDEFMQWSIYFSLQQQNQELANLKAEARGH